MLKKFQTKASMQFLFSPFASSENLIELYLQLLLSLLDWSILVNFELLWSELCQFLLKFYVKIGQNFIWNYFCNSNIKLQLFDDLNVPLIYPSATKPPIKIFILFHNMSFMLWEWLYKDFAALESFQGRQYLDPHLMSTGKRSLRKRQLQKRRTQAPPSK